MSHLRFPITMAVSLVLWLPTLSQLLDGRMDLLPAVGYFSAGLALTSIGVGMLTRMVERYAAANDDVQEDEGADRHSREPVTSSA